MSGNTDWSTLENRMTAGAATLEIVSFPVEGMTCASCVNRITRFLNKVEGVEQANVNLASESATVRFDPARVGIPDLVAAVDAAGYVARVEQAASAWRRRRDRGQPACPRWAAGLP
jgi:copper chaperone CopZ